MTYEEACQWSAYLDRRGSVHLGMRLEWGFALIAMTINRALGGKAGLVDFMPHAATGLEPHSITDVMSLLGGKK